MHLIASKRELLAPLEYSFVKGALRIRVVENAEIATELFWIVRAVHA